MSKRRKRRSSKKEGGVITLRQVLLSLVIVGVIALGITFGEKLGLPTWDELLNPSPAASYTVAEGTLQVHWLDVGQADAILIQAPEKTVLIDSGDVGMGENTYQQLLQFGVEKIDLWIGTHAHADHIGGIQYIMEHLPVEEIVLSDLPDSMVPTTKVYTGMLEEMEKQGKTITSARPGDTYDLGGGAVLTILGPTQTYDDLNDTSVMSRLDFGETSFLFSGDAETPVEEDLLATGGNFQADVLDVAHHGSDTSSSNRWLQTVDPDVAVISVGEGNSYGHPSNQTLQRLQALGTEVYRTDLNGVVTITSDGTTLSVGTEK